MSDTVAVDTMGGDFGPEVTLPASALFLRDNPDARLLLVGDQDVLAPSLEALSAFRGRFELVHAPEVVAMDESPVKALRHKKRSSLRVSLEQVASGNAVASVSAGNTGALMVIAKHVLKMLPGVDRPAIVRPLPAAHGLTYALDLGANAECSPQHLVQFAVMGSVLARCKGIDVPRVGLLNIGTEPGKGNELVRQAEVLLRQAPVDYHGFVEGNDLYSGAVDVVVCDGFTGNVALKTSEGLARMIADMMREEFTRNLMSRALAVLATPVLRRLRARIDTRRYNGASLLGLRGIVIKSHGGTDSLGFANALAEGLAEGRAGVAHEIGETVSGMLATDCVA